MKNLTRRLFVAGTSAAMTGISWNACAQAYPSGPVRIVVPYPPGAATDALARMLGQALEPQFGSNFIVENKGGAATQIGTKAIASAKPDGQTLGFVDTAFVINPGLFGKALPYDTLRDFTPISLMATAPLVLIAHTAVPAKDIKEFLALAKAQPGSLTYGSAGIGSAPHLAGEQLRQAASIDIRHIPYRGGSTVLTDLIAGHVQFGFTTVPTMLEHIRAGTVRALVVTSPERVPQLPNVPTTAEAGLPKVDTTPLFGLIGQAGLPEATVARLGAAASQLVKTGPLRARLIEAGFVPVGSTPQEFSARVQGEIAKWAEVVKAGDIKPNA
ncbi:twin-arginine translocation pathway signal protein [Rhodoferax koreense]|uniref:Twin-arginine translocation pathway signal protein n=1 Tax=Rhodoferax koreensis TaxID=1842727 RepID=A0A1P8K0J4_9BURK|nr:tripartite tricarboxylate transporter substrate binding protein [Rhodoferax koreense]APW39530.1 twin-arginine translocation pathway signal protein [Rhodoferax koreense]